MEEGSWSGSIKELAFRAGVTDRHLRRVFKGEFGVSPIRFAQSQKLLLARRLLLETGLSVTDAAMAGGFDSIRRFNALFRERYGMSPSDYRKRNSNRSGDGNMDFRLEYRPPLAWSRLLGFFARRAVDGMEEVEGLVYRRAVGLTGEGRDYRGWIEVRPADSGDALMLRVDAGLIPVLPRVFARVRRLFDLDCRPDLVADTLGELAAHRPGLRLPGSFDGFELAVRAVLGQQVSTQAARTLAGRFVSALGEPVETPFPTVRGIFPAPSKIAALGPNDLGGLGITSARARTILALSRAVESGALSLDPGPGIARTVETLLALPGIGDWTAQYIAMRALAWPDAFPAADLGVMKALGEKKKQRVLAMAETWRPWRAYAVMHLWASLGEKA
jgi:AraC family transcriptional regulator of adaptative response / DNA-3-methyladenine glycosylase II